MKLHEWFYSLIDEICYDRDYLYLVYVRHFQCLMTEIIEKGNHQPSGAYVIPGLKNDLQACIDWQLERRLNWTGSNILAIHCRLQARSSGTILEARQVYFDLSTGIGVG